MIFLTCSRIYLHHMSDKILLLCNEPCYLYLSYFHSFIFLPTKDRTLIQNLLHMQLHTHLYVLHHMCSSNKLALQVPARVASVGMHMIMEKHLIYP